MNSNQFKTIEQIRQSNEAALAAFDRAIDERKALLNLLQTLNQPRQTA